MAEAKAVPALLIVSGLDPSGGAGFIADVRLAERFGCRPVGVVTAQTVQDTRGVRSVHVEQPALIQEQLHALLSDVEVAGVKIGMVGNAEVAEVIATALALTRAPVVWDPVLSPTSGAGPLLSGSLASVAERLSPHLELMTPNVEEAAHLGNTDIRDLAGAERAALAISERFQTAVLVTGGHLPGRPVDLLAYRGDVTEVVGERIGNGDDVHGTGCALTTAIAAALARGRTVVEAVVDGAQNVRKLLATAPRPGRGLRAVI